MMILSNRSLLLMLLSELIKVESLEMRPNLVILSENCGIQKYT